MCFFSQNPTVLSFLFFFFNDTATTEIYTLSLHDALPISHFPGSQALCGRRRALEQGKVGDRKSTRPNSSHMSISYAVFCLKKKNSIQVQTEISKTKTKNTAHTKSSESK